MAERRSELHNELIDSVDGEVRFDRLSRALYSTDASVYQIEPLGVVVPRSAEAVARAVAIAAEHGVPITPRGGGTSQAGQSIGAGLVLDTSKHLNRILAIDVDKKRIGVGMIQDGAEVRDGKKVDEVKEYRERQTAVPSGGIGSLADQLRGALKK